ncbi:hypothetical protein Asppvi_002027 [Aspergillus pseudoviridinutans]|uniref:HSF-type DNA-binding domain-containing protein n=1 Tax=Aspergillus pseudoviridinutans TaxID=1517512 RepID=A0A9P3BLJ9_9EURO|nr:uncharacterized protein Asppvi_002027 [Aspergillus pseudoviridinutans]GIJ92749.1 hypothetical protein Asppvi_002027 [Aspergillus pseudoviridinutans]
MSQLAGNLSPSCLHAGAGSTIGFDLHPLPDGLEPPTSIELALTGILLYLEKYLQVLNNNGSISVNRGDSPFSTHLCEQLKRLFTIPKPQVIEGTLISWVRVVLSAGPSPGHLDQITPLKVGESTIQLSEEDHKLLASGRPWQFLNPWPDKRDYERELALVNEDMDGLRKMKYMLRKAAKLVDDVELQLSFRLNLLSDRHLEQTRPTAFESEDYSYDISAREHISPSAAENSMRIDSRIDDASHQKFNGVPATEPSDSKPSIFRNSSPADRTGQSNPIAEKGYVDVTRLPTCEATGSEERIFTSRATEDTIQRTPQDNSTSPPATVPPFIEKLVDALEDPGNSELIGWSEDGSSFIIHNWKDFEKKVLPSICLHKTYQNFICLLRQYDFQLKRPSPKTAWSETGVREYFNRHFRRGDKDSLPLIQAQRKRSREPRAWTEDSATPSPSVTATSLPVESNEGDVFRGDTRAKTGGPRVKFFKTRRSDSSAVSKRQKI